MNKRVAVKTTDTRHINGTPGYVQNTIIKYRDEHKTAVKLIVSTTAVDSIEMQ